jgi:hypothetical protein
MLTVGVMSWCANIEVVDWMVYAFDTLGYAKRLRDAGVSQEHAEAHAEAAREFVMGELVTHYDLEMSTTVIRRDFEATMASLRHYMDTSISTLRKDMETSVANLRKDMEASMAALRNDLERLELRLTLRLGGMFAVSVAILAAIIKL